MIQELKMNIKNVRKDREGSKEKLLFESYWLSQIGSTAIFVDSNMIAMAGTKMGVLSE